jgi:hypothetical protein
MTSPSASAPRQPPSLLMRMCIKRRLCRNWSRATRAALTTQATRCHSYFGCRKRGSRQHSKSGPQRKRHILFMPSRMPSAPFGRSNNFSRPLTRCSLALCVARLAIDRVIASRPAKPQMRSWSSSGKAPKSKCPVVVAPARVRTMIVDYNTSLRGSNRCKMMRSCAADGKNKESMPGASSGIR